MTDLTPIINAVLALVAALISAFAIPWVKRNTTAQDREDFLRKMLYLASRKIAGHWAARCRNWDMVLAQLQLMFQDRQTA